MSRSPIGEWVLLDDHPPPRREWWRLPLEGLGVIGLVFLVAYLVLGYLAS